MSDTIDAKLDSEILQINPGKQVETSLSIKNTGTIVDVFNVEVEGLDNSWHQLSASRVSLFPDDSEKIRLTITVPMRSDSTARKYPFTLNITSDRNSSEMEKVTCVLEVLPFHQFKASVSPQRVSGAVGRFTLTLENGGNSKTGCFLEGSDPENLCQFSFDPSRSPTVAAGSKSSVNVIVEPGQRPLRLPSKIYNLTRSAKPGHDNAAPTIMNTVFEATPRLPGWAIPAAIAATVVLVAIIVVAVVLTRGPSPIETPFLLNAGESITFAFPLPESTPMRIELNAEWEGSADSLDVTLERPDSSRFTTVRITPADRVARFILDESEIGHGLIGWKINLANPNDTGQADGVISMNRISLN
jgi:hypothetical protein